MPSLRALLASRHDVVAVLSRPDAPAGRGRRLTPSPVAALSREAGIEVLTPPTPRDPAFLDRLRAIAPDGCAVVAYGGLIPPSALAVPAHGWVNLHFSVLPAWRGAAPVQRAIMAGDEVTGATTFRLVEELDAGPTYGVMHRRRPPRRHSRDAARSPGRRRRRAARHHVRRHRGRHRSRRVRSRPTRSRMRPS